ncbi:MAG: hypothetical protein ACFFF4_02330 [Candidatus Thorarchaeota archaeon]
MNKINLFLVFMTILGIFSTAVCGLWLWQVPGQLTSDGIAFHVMVGGVTIFFTLLVILRLIRQPQ